VARAYTQPCGRDMQGCGAVLFLGRGRWGRKKHRVDGTATRRCEERCSGGGELGRHVEAVVALIGVLFAGDEGGVGRYRSCRGDRAAGVPVGWSCAGGVG
jgi:hypothetical protein